MPQDVDTSTPVAMIAGRHIAGMAIVALANPLIYFGGGFYQWSLAFMSPLLFAVIVYGLYALFFTKRAKAAWPGSFFMLAWVLLGLGLLGVWMDKSPRQDLKTTAPVSETWGENDKPAPESGSADWGAGDKELASDPPPKGQTFTYEEASGTSTPQAPPQPVNWDDFTPVDDKGNPLPQRR
jgi:hypothetical protein